MKNLTFNQIIVLASLRNEGKYHQSIAQDINKKSGIMLGTNVLNVLKALVKYRLIEAYLSKEEFPRVHYKITKQGQIALTKTQHKLVKLFDWEEIFNAAEGIHHS